MKKIITGASSLLTGAIIFLASFVAASNTGIRGGPDHYGPFWNAVSENRLTQVLVISIIFMVAGIVLMVWGNVCKDENNR